MDQETPLTRSRALEPLELASLGATRGIASCIASNWWLNWSTSILVQYCSTNTCSQEGQLGLRLAVAPAPVQVETQCGRPSKYRRLRKAPRLGSKIHEATCLVLSYPRLQMQLVPLLAAAPVPANHAKAVQDDS
jgi:hypothetical protein